MRRRATTNRIKTVALTDPQPEFVSLVKAGANGTPWLAVKDDEAGPALKVDRVGLGARGYEIVGVEFSKAEKWTQESAQEWLTSGGYEGYVLEDGETSVVAKSEDGIPEGARVVEMDGVKVSIIKAETAQKEDKPENGGDVNPGANPEVKITEPAAKSDLRAKFDEYAAWDSEKPGTLSEALKAGNDGVPPGYYELETAFRVTLFRAMRDEPSLVPTITTEFGAVIQKMAEAFTGFVGRNKADAEANLDRWMLGDTKETTVTTKTDAPAQPAQKTEPETTPAVVDAQKGGTDPTKEEPVKDKPGETQEKAKQEPATPEPSLAEQIASAVGVAVKGAISEVVAPLAARVEEVAKKADSAMADVAQRVASLETEGPSRKSADVEESDTGSQKTVDAAEARYNERALRGAFGISGGSMAFGQRTRS